MVLSIWSQVIHVSPFPQPLGTSWHHPFALFDSSDRKEMWHGGPAARAFSGWRNSGWTTGRRFQGPWRNETIYPLVIQQFAIENCHLNLPIKNCGFPGFPIVLLVYHRVSWRSTYFINVHQVSSDSHEMANFPNHFSSKFINPSTQSSNFQPASPRPPATLAAPAAAAPRRRPRRPPPAAGRPRRSRAPGRPRPRGHLGGPTEGVSQDENWNHPKTFQKMLFLHRKKQQRWNVFKCFLSGGSSEMLILAAKSKDNHP